MRVCVAGKLRDCVRQICADYSSESPYINLPTYYMRPQDQDETTQEVQMGPPSMYDDYQSDRKRNQNKNVEDIRRQGERPDPKDPLTRGVVPVTDTVHGNVRSNEQDEEWDMTTPEGRSESRETIPFEIDELVGNPFDGW